MTSDCICAPATAPGGAISIVRVSGAGCLGMVDTVVDFRHGSAASASGFNVKFGVIPDLDEVLVSVFKAPHSYTGEDMAEISCHASPYIVSGILDRLCAAGCRLAQAGEFTQRAFVAGKMDLSQAEAVADLIASDSAASHKMAFSQLRGAYSQKLHELKRQMTELAALLELELDFSEEDVEFADRSRLRGMVQETLLEVQKLAESFKLGNAFKKGIPVAIVGAVNSGKSTLLNALLGEDRAIVSDIPGTTRDTVEEVLVLNGVKYRFIDTAGLRETDETVERMGIERSFAQIGQASVVIVLLDGSAVSEDLLPIVAAVKAHLREDSRVIWVRSKADLLLGSKTGCFDPQAPVSGPFGIRNEAFCSRLGIPEAIELSALTGQGLDKLKEAISKPDSDSLAADAVLVTNQRHYDALRRAAEDLNRVQDGLEGGSPTDLVAEDLRSSLSALGEIFGEILPDDILGAVFSRFCIGK
ncbi:MAG: tRNA uridine-5-carboxymethylaminomethyl(34) synthesis GTPase MnmE [Bacteroidales bacterium]|nr:tRNA uridine-5-carboxymethylaminomethyl(34) synthesis GTPase MnmE [Bacteroidales bacterium]